MPPRRRLLLLLLALACSGGGAAVDTAPGNATSSPLACSELSRVCTAFLAFPAAGNASVLQSMFDASPADLTSDPAASPGYAFVRKNCSCLASRTYLANTTYTVPSAVPLNATAAQVAVAAYAGLAVPPPGGALQRPPRPGAVVALHLICGCSSGPWNYLLSYVGADGDTVESLSSRFGASMDAIEAANGMPGPDPISTGKVYYIPLNSVPGQPYAAMSSALVPAPAPIQNTLPGMVVDVFDREKPIVFTYEEILASTDLFSDANLLGHGTYGSVYYGVLRDQEVAIKRMTSTNTKEFIVEMKVLCKVHHASLVELIGYAASKDELFLVYEYSQKGSLKNHLHDPQSKGYTPLSWIYRVQIALDAARGLEYIHEHTKDHYVHRDIKSSNILLDGSFRAKISDFGLAKLGVRSNDAEASVTKVVGTFGYLAPEYLRDGLATAKCDVYAFGVVLFELISGKEAITKAGAVGASSNSERRSLASVMLTALRNCHDPTCVGSLKDCIDPNLMDLYPHDCIYQMAMLAKQCADEDPVLRPDMKQAVITLSQILLSSIEWEATLGGNSQVFSGLVAGR
ncbi:unnamed protein product [Triticum turgidum subsp. durum]|uniref:LysM domain receptor-like kinase 3 n=1 Tax=Triticum turgidum subsp. durum TaxID=4567 RepID=A0A9R0RP24_TRITD|nr:unnamed protein product [Triticum turgidum subsp. durum]